MIGAKRTQVPERQPPLKADFSPMVYRQRIENAPAEKVCLSSRTPGARLHPLGTYAYLGIFAWSVGLILLAPTERISLVAGLSLAVAGLLYPTALRRLIQARWLLIASLLVLANALWLEEVDRLFWGVPFSTQGLHVGLHMAVRALVVLCSVDGFSSSVDVSEVAGLLERLGLHGLGFSLGIAFNLLPTLRESTASAWYSLWMRGGLRRQPWRSLKLLAVTVVVNTLRRGEEIALAAETRAYFPANSRPLPAKSGTWDRAVLMLCFVSAMAILFFKL